MEVEIYSAVRSLPDNRVENCRYILVDEIIGLRIQNLPEFDVIINVAMKRSSRTLYISDEVLSDLNFSIPLEIIRRTSSESTLVINTSTYIQNFEGAKGKTVETYGACKQLLKNNSDMSALFATNYDVTLGAMMAINEIGINVPDTLSVFGFDDLPFAQVIKPHLSVIEQPTTEIGKIAAQMLLDRMSGENKGHSNVVVLRTSTVLRDSVSNKII
jgi:hypothetical protein